MGAATTVNELRLRYNGKDLPLKRLSSIMHVELQKQHELKQAHGALSLPEKQAVSSDSGRRPESAPWKKCADSPIRAVSTKPLLFALKERLNEPQQASCRHRELRQTQSSAPPSPSND